MYTFSRSPNNARKMSRATCHLSVLALSDEK
jgi:hypothetical protein